MQTAHIEKVFVANESAIPTNEAWFCFALFIGEVKYHKFPLIC